MTGTNGSTWRVLLLAASTFLATAMVIGGGVTALLEPRIEFSLFLGIPAGLLGGVVAAGAVAAGLVSEGSMGRRIAITVAGFSLAFLLSFGAALLVLQAGVVVSLGLSLVLGLAIGGLVFVRSRAGPTRESGSPTQNRPDGGPT